MIEPQSAVCANFPREHPLHLGPDPAVVADADLVLLVNCRAPWYPPSANPFPDARVVVIDEVPQRPHVVYQVLHAHQYLEGDVAATLDALRGAVVAEAGHVEERRARLSAIHDRQRDQIATDEEQAAQAGDVISAALLVRALRELLPADAVVVDETITHSRTVQRHLLAGEPGRWTYVQGGLGQGTAVALGAKLALGQRMVVLVVGDGAFLYNPVVQALLASGDLDLPILVVVFNNRQYLSMKLNHLRFYPDGTAVANDDFSGVDLSGQPPLSELGRPFGLPGWEIGAAPDLRPGLKAAVAEVIAGRTALVNVTLAR